MDKRVYIGGLSKNITEKDLESRFSSFGDVLRVDIIRQPTGECRGFAYITLKTADNQWKKCVSLFNGAKWGGMTLKVQEAKPDYKQRLKNEWEVQKSLPKLDPSCKKRRRGRSCVEFARDMSLVTYNNVEHRKGWKKLKCGRIVSVMRLKKDDGSRITIDPSHYKGNFLKFSDKDIDYKPKSFVQLPYFYEGYETNKEKQQSLILDENKSKDNFDEKSDDKSKQNNFALFPPKSTDQPIVAQTHLPPSIINDLKKLKLEKEKNQIHSEALNRRAQEKYTEKEKISRTLRTEDNTKHKLFDDNDEQDNIKQNAMKLFDSDESDKDESKSMDIVINPLFEGASGRNRLNLQKKFRGDERFKLTEDFVSDEEENNQKELPSSRIDNKSLEEERENQFDILKGIFGDDMRSEQSNLKKKESQWKDMVHFDPDAPEAKLLEVQKREDSCDLPEFTPSLSQPLPKVSKDVKIEINADLKGIFTSNARPSFSLLGNDNSTESETQDTHDENESILIDKKISSITDKIDKVANQKPQISSEPLFFFNFGDEELLKRSHFREMKIFMRTSPTEEIVSHWQETSRDLTKEYKRKHKSVSRKLNKINKQRKH